MVVHTLPPEAWRPLRGLLDTASQDGSGLCRNVLARGMRKIVFFIAFFRQCPPALLFGSVSVRILDGLDLPLSSGLLYDRCALGECPWRKLRFNSSNVGDKPTSMRNCARLNNSTRLQPNA